MNTMRELSDAELDIVAGGHWMDSWNYCVIGSKAGGSDGLYPKDVPCSNGQMHDLAELVQTTAANGRVILGGGSPA